MHVRKLAVNAAEILINFYISNLCEDTMQAYPGYNSHFGHGHLFLSNKMGWRFIDMQGHGS